MTFSGATFIFSYNDCWSLYWHRTRHLLRKQKKVTRNEKQKNLLYGFLMANVEAFHSRSFHQASYFWRMIFGVYKLTLKIEKKNICSMQSIHIYYIFQVSTGGKRKKDEIFVDCLDFNKKILHTAWHPSENIIAVAATNNLFLLQDKF